jgi:hypothetical protein
MLTHLDRPVGPIREKELYVDRASVLRFIEVPYVQGVLSDQVRVLSEWITALRGVLSSTQ